MINEKILKENGYKKYQDLLYTSDCLYQKRITDEKGIKYFINFYKYGQEYEVRMDIEKDIYSLELTLYAFNSQTTSLEKVEKDIESMWKDLDCDYYEKEEK